MQPGKSESESVANKSVIYAWSQSVVNYRHLLVSLLD